MDKRVTIRIPKDLFLECESEAKESGVEVCSVARQYLLRGRIRDLGTAEVEKLFARALDTVELLKTKINMALTFNTEGPFTRKQKRTLWRLNKKQNQKSLEPIYGHFLRLIQSLGSMQDWMQKTNERQDKFVTAINQLAANSKNLHIWLQERAIK